MDNVIILSFATLTIFSVMFAIGLNHSFEQLTFLWSRPALLLRSLLAVIVLVPVVVGLLLWLIDLPPDVATGLAVLAAAPGPPLMYKRTGMAGGAPDYAASLQLTLALLAVLITPLILAIFGQLLDLLTERVTPFNVASQVGEVTFLPVIIGLLTRRLAPGLAARIAGPVRVIANVLLILLVLVLIVLLVLEPNLRAMLWLGGLPTAVIITIVGASLAIGHVLSGPPREAAFRSRHRRHRAQYGACLVHREFVRLRTAVCTHTFDLYGLGGAPGRSILGLEPTPDKLSQAA